MVWGKKTKNDSTNKIIIIIYFGRKKLTNLIKNHSITQRFDIIRLSECLGSAFFSCVCVSGISCFSLMFSFFFFLHAFQLQETKYTVHTLFTYCSCICSHTVHKTRNHFIKEKNIKNEFHITTYIFKNDFCIVFLVFIIFSKISTFKRTSARKMMNKEENSAAKAKRHM